MKQPGAGIVVSLLIGVCLGYGLFTAPFQWYRYQLWRAESLAGVVNRAEAASTPLVYDADVDLAGVSWSPPNIPAPFVGSMPAPGIHQNAEINSEGFRRRGEVGAKAPGVVRIFLTGGSTAYGSGASSQALTIAGLLGAQLNAEPADARRYEVIIAANPSWASTQERILIENKLSELEPDLVIALSGNNDVHWGFNGHNVLDFHSHQEQYFLNALALLHRMTGQGSLPRRGVPSPHPVDPALVAQRLEKNATLAAYALERVGAAYVFVLQPTITVTRKPLSARERERVREHKRAYFVECYARIRSRMSEWVAGNLTTLDTSAVFDTLTAADEIFIDSYHFGDEGSRRVAAATLERLRPLLHPVAHD